MLELKLLGEPEIYRNGMRIEPLPPRKTVALLAYLTATGRRHRRERLCSIFWEVPDDPRAALRWSLTKLRHAVDDPEEKHIVADREGVTFETGQAKVDLHDVRAAVAQGLAGVPTQELEQLAGLFRGTFIEGTDLPNCLEFQAWCTAEREELRAAHSQILTELVDRLKDEPRKALPHARTLADIASDRGQVEALIETLRAADRGPPSLAGEKPSIAVLPFQNMSGDPEQEYFADGIADDIITELSRYPLLFVTARNSSFAYREQAPIDIKLVSRELGVRYVLEGSVRRAGNRVRLTVQLIDATTGAHIWAERYDRDLKDVFAVQDEITERIVGAIEPQFLSAEMQRAHRKREINLDAWDSFMRAFWHLARFTREDNAEVQRLSRQAIELDPTGARPYGLLCVAYIMDALYGWQNTRADSLRIARGAAERAVALDDQSSMSARCLGHINLYERRHDEAARDFRHAISLCPTEAENHALLGTVLGLSGDHQGALRVIKKAIRLSPRDPFRATWFSYLAISAAIRNRYEESVDWAHKSIQANPQFPGGYRSLATSFAFLGRTDEASEALTKLREVVPAITISLARENLPIKHEADLEHYLDGLRKAGLREG